MGENRPRIAVGPWRSQVTLFETERPLRPASHCNGARRLQSFLPGDADEGQRLLRQGRLRLPTHPTTADHLVRLYGQPAS